MLYGVEDLQNGTETEESIERDLILSGKI